MLPISSQTIKSGESVRVAISIPFAFINPERTSVFIPTSNPAAISFLSSIIDTFLYSPPYQFEIRRA